MAKEDNPAITIDGKEYPLSELSDEAKSQVGNLRVTDQEITRLEQQLAIHRTARNTYSRALAEALPDATEAK
ncbi:DUF6447 family protein [Halomonas organivorans]|uniref:Uncharacterized protein n=1 Tax=Halomonas organivorans TaxID=257772 RepID=A0A7W5G6S4_9GAMM|nr:DUF6447 family protein [Halomonas organivorans]MBB3142878.1 hypothetical protein [Halomonas organivorans]